MTGHTSLIFSVFFFFPQTLISDVMIGDTWKSVGNKNVYFENEERNNNAKCTVLVVVSWSWGKVITFFF